MELKLFAHLINTLSKVASRLKVIVNLPKAVREKYRQSMDNIYRLIDTMLNRVLIRLNNILRQDADDDFLRGPLGWTTTVNGVRPSGSSGYAAARVWRCAIS